MLTVWTAIPIKRHPGIGVCLAIAHRLKELCWKRLYSFWQDPSPGANWSIGIPHLFQSTAGIEENSNAFSFRHINPNHSGISASSQEGSSPGIHQLWAMQWEVLNCFSHSVGEHFRSCQHNHFFYFSEILYMVAQQIIRYISCPGINKRSLWASGRTDSH